MKDISPGFTAQAPPKGAQSDIISSECGLPGLLANPPERMPGPGGAAEAALGPVPGSVQSEYSSAACDCLPPLTANESDGDRRQGGPCAMPTMVPGAGV